MYAFPICEPLINVTLFSSGDNNIYLTYLNLQTKFFFWIKALLRLPDKRGVRSYLLLNVLFMYRPI